MNISMADSAQMAPQCPREVVGCKLKSPDIHPPSTALEILLLQFKPEVTNQTRQKLPEICSFTALTISLLQAVLQSLH